MRVDNTGFTLGLALLTFFAFLFHVISALFTGVAMLFGGGRAPQVVYLEQRTRRRKPPTVLEAYEPPDGEDEDESEEEMEQSA